MSKKDNNKKHAPEGPKEGKKSQFFPDLEFKVVPVLEEEYYPGGVSPGRFLMDNLYKPCEDILGFSVPHTGQLKEFQQKFIDCCRQKKNDSREYPCRPNVQFAKIWLDQTVQAFLDKAWNMSDPKRADQVVQSLIKVIPHSKFEPFIPRNSSKQKVPA